MTLCNIIEISAFPILVVRCVRSPVCLLWNFCGVPAAQKDAVRDSEAVEQGQDIEAPRKEEGWRTERGSKHGRREGMCLALVISHSETEPSRFGDRVGCG